MTHPNPQAISTIGTPKDIVISLINTSAVPSEITQDQIAELKELGLLDKGRKSPTAETYTIGKILDTLALAGAISALSGYQSAIDDRPSSFVHLHAINNCIKSLDHQDPENLLQGAYLDYQFHREVIATSRNKPALDAYDAAIRPALWLHGAQFYAQDDALSSIAEHDRIVSALERRDALRARDAIAYHFENAIQVLRRGARDNSFAYPGKA